MKITYRNENGIMIPNVKVPDVPKTPLGIYGRMRRDYLKQNHRSIYSAMMLKGTLLAHLAEIDKTSHEEFEIRVKAMSDAQGVTEELKAKDMLKWTGLMNNIQNSVREELMREIVYAEEVSKWTSLKNFTTVISIRMRNAMTVIPIMQKRCADFVTVKMS